VRNGIKTHKDLDVWKDSIELVVKIYQLVSNFPKEERFGLIDQMKRAAISIPSNIAEGAARNSQKEFLQFLLHCFRFNSRIRNSTYNFKETQLSK